MTRKAIALITLGAIGAALACWAIWPWASLMLGASFIIGNPH
ncbi:MAG TPA: hypothetical protein VG841_04200 [Caulobacterales bacterium]|nr:hypothetical protein [Caulobacterales bacterium]